MKFLYNFGLSQEDERTEAAALALTGSDRVLSVASAGDMGLALLALGCRRVTAVDIDDRQLHLCQLKRAAVAALDRASAVRFLGFMPASLPERERSFSLVAEALPAPSRHFFTEHRDFVISGAIWAGRYERYVRRLLRLARPLFGRKLEGLFDCTSCDEQRDYFKRTFDKKSLRLLFKVAFHPRVFARRGMDPQSLQHRSREGSLAEQYFTQFADLCTGNLARDNHHLQLHLLGRVLSLEAVPAYLTSAGFETARKGLERYELVKQDLVDHLQQSQAGSYDKVHLSNVPDWLPRPEFERVMTLLADRLLPGARVVWRYLHTDYPLPPALSDRFAVDLEQGKELQRADRFPFYDIIPARRI